jgi:transcriptional regulator with XRE-family HTH domain
MARAKRIKRARLSLDVSKHEFANLLGINRITYAKIEDGQSDPRISVFDNVSDLANVELNWLINGGSESMVFRSGH